MQRLVSKTASFVLDILFPPVCATCQISLTSHNKQHGLCDPCWATIPIHTALTCARCGARLAENRKTCHPDTAYRLAAATTYDNTRIKQLIWDLKYARKTYPARPLAALITNHLLLLPIDLRRYEIIPVPITSRRRRERGFNQSELIAEHLTRQLEIPILKNALLRIQHARPQTELESANERAKNVAGCFRAVDLDKLRGKHILLLDDVHTTGATMAEAVRTLRAAGVNEIIAVVAART